MLKLASYAMRGTVQAAVLATSLLLLEFIFPPTAWLSGAVVGLVFLRKGMAGGSTVLLSGAVGFSALIYLITGSLIPGLQLLAVFWVPVIILALILRETVNLGFTFLVAGLLALMAVLVMYLLIGNPADFWETLILSQFPLDQIVEQTQMDESVLREAITLSSQMMSGVLITVIMLGTIISLLLARYWQAGLYNPGGFQSEFHDLGIGTLPAAFAISLALLSVFVKLPIFLNIAPIVIVLFAFQGLAVLHRLVKIRSMNNGWLMGVYLMLLFLLPHTTILLGALGMADNWLMIRQRSGS